MHLEDYFKYYVQGTDHYLIPRDEFVELYNELNNWRQDYKKVKLQYTELKSKYNALLDAQKEQDMKKITSDYIDNHNIRKED